jgi:hypothetical protein
MSELDVVRVALGEAADLHRRLSDAQAGRCELIERANA